MVISRIPAQYGADTFNDHQSKMGQLRNAFRRLLRSVTEGDLADAQRAYDVIAKTLPGVYKTLSGQLTGDYKEIGYALGKGDISGTQRAVVRLQQDIQRIGSTGPQPNPEGNLNSRPRSAASLVDTVTGTYLGPDLSGSIGTRIDIII